ncbi:MAG: hypothetical protein R6V86_00665 [Spirochaetia bacterium]
MSRQSVESLLLPAAADDSQQMDSALRPRLLEDIEDVRSNRRERHVQLVSDLLVAETVTDELDDFGFSLCNLVGGDECLADFALVDQGRRIGEIP